jgi:predicted lipoprotein
MAFLCPLNLKTTTIKIAKAALFLVLLTGFVYCGKNKKKPEETTEPFDKEAMLTNMADNVILPNYTAFKKSFDSLVTAYATFKTSGLQSDFQDLKQKLHAAYFTYQRIDLFEFGPAENVILRMNFNVFPTDTVQIKSNINSGTYDLGSASNFDAKGLPALDYLFYGKNQTELSVIQSFTASANKRQYVTDLLNDMSSKINSVINSWSSYRAAFISSQGTDVGSSIGYLVNQINYELDYLKNAKVGIPLGKKTLGVQEPTKCEVYYGGQSVQYAMETLYSIENAYLGRKINGANGPGFDDYLDHIKAEYNGGPLNGAIIQQFEIAKSKLAAVQNPLSTQVMSNPAQVDAAYIELVKLLVLLKTDMPSQLGVVITYQDGDGD